MASRTSDPLASIRSEGALLPADFLARLTEPRSAIEGLAPESYHLAGERLGEAASRAWARLQGVWTAFREARERLPESDSGTSLTRERWLLPLFQELGYGRLLTTRALEVGGKPYAVSHLWNHTPIHLISFRRELDKAEPGVRGAARSTPHGLVQELLNRSDGHLWALVSNGLRLRLLRDGSALARQAYVEWDLEYLFENELYPDFLVLWLVCHQSRVEADRPEECWLERWAQDAQRQGIRAYEELRKGVRGAIEALGRGFLAYSSQESRNHALRERLEGGALDATELYRQLLRVVYRLLFLMVAEERGLVHPREADAVAVKRYGDFFSLGRLRRLADRTAGSRHPDLLRALRLVFDKLGSDEGSPELGLPALGGFLFSPGAAEALDGCDIDNHHLLTAVRALAVVGEGRARRPVSFRELGARELGSVYESLLELVPVVNARAGTFELRAASGNERKTTGSYYTPEPLIQALLDSALEPVLEEAARKPDYEAAILGLRVCDPACGSGHFLISAAHRIAHRLATLRSGGVEPSIDALNHARRDVIGHCLYGVDLNPMAVELCKVSLWLEALEPGKPLTFLENRVKQGNSLLGATPALLAAGIPDEAFTAIEGDDKEYVKKYKKANKEERKKRGQFALFDKSLEPWDRLGDVTAAARVVESVPDDTLPAVRRKENEYAKMIRSSSYRFSRLWADAWCAAFVWKKTDEFPYPITEEEFRRLEATPHNVKPWMEEEIQRLADQYGFFHWHIEFPDVFRAEAEPEVRGNDPTGWTGGFDVVLGNPPWETMSPDVKEFFSIYKPSIRIETAAEQSATVAELLREDTIRQGWENHRRTLYSLVLFLRESGRYRLFAEGNLGKGDFNVYRMFVELGMQILGHDGSISQIVPDGFYSGANSSAIRAEIFAGYSAQILLGFENHRGAWFEGIHASTKFTLYSARKGGSTDHLDVAFSIKSQSQLTQVLSGELLRVPMSIIREFAPETLSVMEFQEQLEVDIAAKMYSSWSKFGQVVTGFPHRRYMREIDMGTERDLLSEQRSGLPVFEGRMVGQFDHRAKGYRSGRGRAAEWQDLPFTSESKAICPQWYVPSEQVPSRVKHNAAHYRSGSVT
jgi:hypothetical protein